MADYKLYSSDSHVSEPPDLWKKRIDRQFLYRAPFVDTRTNRHGEPEDFMIYEGFPPHPVSIGLAAKAGSQDARDTTFQAKANKYSEALPGGWDPAERLKDQELDNVEGEVMHPTLGFRMFWLKDPQLQQAVFASYNDWLAEDMVAYDPKRLVGLALISLYDVQEGVKEVRRAWKKGLKGAMIAVSPANNIPYSDPMYDPFWAECQELDIPITLHIITGAQESRWSIAYWNPEMVLYGVVGYQEAERTLAYLIMSGVLERFPRLKLVTSEAGSDWMPRLINRMDRAARPGGAAAISINVFPTKLTMKPSEYWARQCYVSFITERDTAPNRHILGLDHVMWASDYPHYASTFPNSQQTVDMLCKGVPEDEKRKIVRDNCIELYKIDIPVAV